MTFIDYDYDMDDVGEDQIVPAGRYNLVVTSAEEGLSKNNNVNICVILEVTGVEGAASIFHYITFPGENHNPKQTKFMLLNLKRFLYCFCVPHDDKWRFDTNDMVGCQAELAIEVEESPDGRIQNKLVIPPLPEGV